MLSDSHTGIFLSCTYIYDYICTIATYGIWVCQDMRYTSQNYSLIGEMKFKSSKNEDAIGYPNLRQNHRSEYGIYVCMCIYIYYR